MAAAAMAMAAGMAMAAAMAMVAVMAMAAVFEARPLARTVVRVAVAASSAAASAEMTAWMVLEAKTELPRALEDPPAKALKGQANLELLLLQRLRHW